MHVCAVRRQGHKQHIYHVASTLPCRSFAYSGDSADCRFAYINICRLHLLQLKQRSRVRGVNAKRRVGLGYIVQSATPHNKAKGHGRTIVDPVESLIGDERPPGAMPSVRLAPSLLLHQRMHRPRRSARREASRSQAQPLPYLGGGTRQW